MLRTLSIRDFVIVDAIELEFSSGFSVFTGETGAGKSILIDALQLALGGRGDASVVREGAAKADITAEFAVSGAAHAWLLKNEFALDEGGALLRRVIDNAGRSKAFINGIAATATQLRDLGDMLVDIHGQHAHQSLLKSEAQRALLDNQAAFKDAGAGADARAVAATHKAWRALARQREQFDTNAKNDEGIELHPVRERCFAVMKKKGLPVGQGQTQARAVNACDIAYFAQAVLKRATAGTTLPSMIAAGESLGTSYRSPFNYGNRIGRGQHDGVSLFRSLKFDQACSCIKYTSKPFVP